MLFKAQTPFKTTTMETFWKFSKYKHSCKMKVLIFSVINKKLHILRTQLLGICSSVITSLYFYKSK